MVTLGSNEKGEASRQTAAEVMLRSLREYGVDYIFSNFGTDHPPILEAAARIRKPDPEAIPELVTCPHESAALSMAHGYAATTGEPQAVLVHVDVGTQNLGAMVHNAHRGSAPVFIIAGQAPVSFDDQPGARNVGIHFIQDIFDQRGIVRQFCRWDSEYRSTANPDEYVARGLEVASTPRRGPTYLTATREAWESPTEAEPGQHRSRGSEPTTANKESIDEIVEMVSASDAPLVITSKLGLFNPRESIEALMEFAENAGAGVVETRAAALSMPWTHRFHLGFTPQAAFEETDLIILADTDVPWVPGSGNGPPEGIPILQIDVDPNKPDYPQWNFPVDHAIRADPVSTLSEVANRLEGTSHGHDIWPAMHAELLDERSDTLEEHRGTDGLTPELLTDAIDDIISDNDIIINETTTNQRTVQDYLSLKRPGSYMSSHASGLGWAQGAAIGAKLASPDSTVLSLVGDGSYVFSVPTATAWVAAANDAPTLTVVYNNSGWNAVRTATLRDHPEGSSSSDDVPESKFDPRLDLSHAAEVVDTHTAVVKTQDHIHERLVEALEAVNNGRPAVLDVWLESI